MRHMQYINLLTNEYPLTEADIRAANKTTSFPIPFAATNDYAEVRQTVRPPESPLEYRVVEGAPIQVDGVWTQVWETVSLTEEEKKAGFATVQNDISSVVKQKLDAFAMEKGYDNILTACTYATSTVAKFAKEGKYAAKMRDSTWAALYDIFEQAEEGLVEHPKSFADIETKLPTLVWLK